jgi:hypothetical protein
MGGDKCVMTEKKRKRQKKSRKGDLGWCLSEKIISAFFFHHLYAGDMKNGIIDSLTEYIHMQMFIERSAVCLTKKRGKFDQRKKKSRQKSCDKKKKKAH